MRCLQERQLLYKKEQENRLEKVGAFEILQNLQEKDQAQRSQNHRLIKKSPQGDFLILFAFCGRWKNRTSANGFGDRCSTTKLIAQENNLLFIAENQLEIHSISLYLLNQVSWRLAYW